MTRPRRAIRRVALFGRAQKGDVARSLAELARTLRRRGLEVLMVPGIALPGEKGWAPEPAAARAARHADLLVTLGGDGTILAAARIVAGTRVPILPINLGGLGFLASFEGKETAEALRAALRGELDVESRSMLSARVDPAPVGASRGGRARRLGVALNDVVLKQPTTYRALRLDVHAGKTHLGRIVADGLVAASPSGSTAYSLSAGGPVVAPGLEAMVVTPVCPHTLGMRALVLPASLELAVTVRARDRSGATVSLDGLPGIPVGPGETVRIALKKDAVRFLRRPGTALPVVLPHKLGWSGSPRRSTR
jgi:NAD+ kinase